MNWKMSEKINHLDAQRPRKENFQTDLPTEIQCENLTADALDRMDRSAAAVGGAAAAVGSAVAVAAAAAAAVDDENTDYHVTQKDQTDSSSSSTSLG